MIISVSLLILWALGLSGVSTFYSVRGLQETYPAIMMEIAIMGGLLETSKLLIVSVLHRYWKVIGLVSKSIVVVILATLMMITAIGINGYLAKGHLDQEGPQEQLRLQIAQIDKEMAGLQGDIDRKQAQLGLIDKARSGQLDKENFDKAEQLRQRTQKESKALQAEIDDLQKKIKAKQAEQFPLQQDLSKQEVKLGPIKSLGDLIGLKVPADIVKYINAYFALIFDPLSLGFIVIAQVIMAHHRKEKETGLAHQLDVSDPVDPPKPLFPGFYTEPFDPEELVPHKWTPEEEKAFDELIATKYPEYKPSEKPAAFYMPPPTPDPIVPGTPVDSFQLPPAQPFPIVPEMGEGSGKSTPFFGTATPFPGYDPIQGLKGYSMKVDPNSVLMNPQYQPTQNPSDGKPVQTPIVDVPAPENPLVRDIIEMFKKLGPADSDILALRGQLSTMSPTDLDDVRSMVKNRLQEQEVSGPFAAGWFDKSR